LGIAALIALAMIAVGAWTMRQRINSRASRIFFLAICALVLWLPVSSMVTSLLFFYLGSDENSAGLNYSVMTVEIFAPGLLMLTPRIRSSD
jgi:hypothetical protein